MRDSLRYLVTGGCGFIGSHLCDALIRAGHAVHVLDDLSSGNVANLSHGATLQRGCVTDEAAVAHALEGIDGVFHLAAVASVERCARDWLGTHRINAGGIVTILDTIARRGHRTHVVYASSAAIYGDCRALPIAETAARDPNGAYGADKCASELHAAVATRQHAIPTTGLRFFNVYGPRQDPASPYSGVISIFADRCARGEPIGIDGDGAQTRDFVAVADVVRALAVAMGLPAAAPRVLNVCTGHPTSILELARLVGALRDTVPLLRFRPARDGDIRHSVGDPTLGLATLRLAPPAPLRVGLRPLLAASVAPARTLMAVS